MTEHIRQTLTGINDINNPVDALVVVRDRDGKIRYHRGAIPKNIVAARLNEKLFSGTELTVPTFLKNPPADVESLNPIDFWVKETLDGATEHH